MRTNIVINNKLMSQALKLSGLKTKREAVEAGLEMLVKMARQRQIRAARGKLRWEGDLDAMRRDA
jgi:Arc/MetJ family transcription regulator